MRALHRSLPFALAAMLAVEPAFAAPPAAPTPAAADLRSQLPDPARKAWDAAKQLAGASDFRGALVEFQRAYELSHNPRVLYNVGVTEKLLTHYARAVDAWEREQTEGAGQLSAAELQELKNAVAIVQQFVTTIDVTANETGRDARDRRLSGGQDAASPGPCASTSASTSSSCRSRASSTPSSRSTSRRVPGRPSRSRSSRSTRPRSSPWPWAAYRRRRSSSTAATWARPPSRESSARSGTRSRRAPPAS